MLQQRCGQCVECWAWRAMRAQRADCDVMWSFYIRHFSRRCVVCFFLNHLKASTHHQNIKFKQWIYDRAELPKTTMFFHVLRFSFSLVLLVLVLNIFFRRTSRTKNLPCFGWSNWLESWSFLQCARNEQWKENSRRIRDFCRISSPSLTAALGRLKNVEAQLYACWPCGFLCYVYIALVLFYKKLNKKAQNPLNE